MWIAILFAFSILLCWTGSAYAGLNNNSAKKATKPREKQQYIIKHLNLEDKNGASLDDSKIYALSAEKLGID